MKTFNFSPKNSLASLVLRISVGSMFLLHGIGKLFVVGIDQIVQRFLDEGFPVWAAYFSTAIEIMGGILLLFGLYTRLASLALIPISMGIIMYHFPNGWVFHSKGGGWEYPQLVLVALCVIFLLGTGKYGIKKLL